jgi:pimeloyl-ACP methyl ester carboxylesterase
MASGGVAMRSGARNASIDGKIYSSDWGIDFSRLAFPVRFWHGGQDRNIPAVLAARFVQKLPHAKLEVLDEDGHYSLPMLRNAEIVGELLGWK